WRHLTLPVLRRILPFVAVCSLATPARALAWAEPVGSPPEWRSYWVQTVDSVDVFSEAGGDLSFGQAPHGWFFRVDAPKQNGRLWAYDPLVETWAWLPEAGTQRVPEPSVDDVAAGVAALDPRAYLYLQAPDLAPRLDCIIAGESGWDPSRINA